MGPGMSATRAPAWCPAGEKHAAIQMFEGAQDLDIKPATPGTAVQIARVFCEAGTPIRGVLAFDDRDFSASTRLTLELFDAAGSKLAGKNFGKGDQGQSVEAVATTTGFYTFTMSASETPEKNRNPRYELNVSYQAPEP
jgi:alpha-amylase